MILHVVPAFLFLAATDADVVVAECVPVSVAGKLTVDVFAAAVDIFVADVSSVADTVDIAVVEVAVDFAAIVAGTAAAAGIAYIIPAGCLFRDKLAGHYLR